MTKYEKTFVLICLFNVAFASDDRETCDCDILQIYDPKIPTIYHNFTKQQDKDVNGRFYYASIVAYSIWWTDSHDLIVTKKLKKIALMKKNVSCLTSEHEYDWVLLEEFSGLKDNIASKCLTEDTELKCSAFRNYPFHGSFEV